MAFIADNHFGFFFGRLDYFLGGNLKLCLKVSTVIGRWGHASLFLKLGSVELKTTDKSWIALLKAGKFEND